MHGQLPRNLDLKLVDNEQTYRWLKFEHVKTETGKQWQLKTKQLKQTILRIKT